MAEQKDIVIYGSCVTRDAFEFAPPPNTRLLGYIARQSWASIGKPGPGAPLTDVTLGSAFATKNFRGDLEGDAFARIAKLHKNNPNSYVLVDITDERGGLLLGPEGEVVTRSFEASRAGVLDELVKSWELVPFGSTLHAARFVEAADTLKAQLEQRGLFSRTALVAPLWAPVDAEGNETPKSFGLTAVEANKTLSTYHAFLKETGWNLLEVGTGLPTADPNHKWGFAPFHFERPYYHQISGAISEFLNA